MLDFFDGRMSLHYFDSIRSQQLAELTEYVGWFLHKITLNFPNRNSSETWLVGIVDDKFCNDDDGIFNVPNQLVFGMYENIYG